MKKLIVSFALLMSVSVFAETPAAVSPTTPMLELKGANLKIGGNSASNPQRAAHGFEVDKKGIVVFAGGECRMKLLDEAIKPADGKEFTGKRITFASFARNLKVTGAAVIVDEAHDDKRYVRLSVQDLGIENSSYGTTNKSIIEYIECAKSATPSVELLIKSFNEDLGASLNITHPDVKAPETVIEQGSLKDYSGHS